MNGAYLLLGAMIGSAMMPRYPRFVYVTNFSSATVSMYTINQTTGVLSANGTIAAGTQPRDIVVDPSGRFVYAANNGSNS
ncbi:MAG TPA: beta-propeller fold lactonase family protein, partial [Leptospiraceae bacterium]|nr:beta-propeller fold lactonase family protein [Leptospiraceae bacterium]